MGKQRIFHILLHDPSAHAALPAAVKSTLTRKYNQALFARAKEYKAKMEEYKAAMEAEFEQNAIKPGDANWVHDVQVDFGDAEEDCGWDEEDEEVVDDDDAF